jgi:hypothetical protein
MVSTAQSMQDFGLHTRLSASAVVVGEVTTLNHEVLDDTVEDSALVSVTLAADRQDAEVLSGLWDSLAVETNDDTTERLIAMLNVEVDLGGDLWALGSRGSLGEEEESDREDK